MKFKINDKYWPIISEYLRQNHQSTQQFQYWAQQSDSQTGVLKFEGTPQLIIKYEQIVAEKLLSQFNKEKVTKKDVLLSSWIAQYAKLLQNVSDEDLLCENLNYMLLLNDYNQLKQRICAKKNLLKQKIRQNQIERQKFMQQSRHQQRKIELNLDNLQHRVRMAQNNKQEQNQQLVRVKSVIKNGLWGLSTHIDQKLQRIQMLQSQINQIKNKNDKKI